MNIALDSPIIKLDFPEKLSSVGEVHSYYAKNSRKTRDNVVANFTTLFSPDILIDEFKTYCYDNFVQPYLEYAVQKLVEYGLYSIEREDVERLYLSRFYNSTDSSVLLFLDEIISEANDEFTQADSVYENRTQWEATRPDGQFDAYMNNKISDFRANLRRKRTQNKVRNNIIDELKDVIKNGEFQVEIANYLSQSIMNIYDTFAYLLTTTDEYDASGIPNADEVSKSLKIFSNIKLGRIPEPKIQDAIQMVLQANPFNILAIEYLYTNFFDIDGKFQSFFDKLNIDSNIIKRDIIIKEIVKSPLALNPEDTIALESVNKLMTKLSLDDENRNNLALYITSLKKREKINLTNSKNTINDILANYITEGDVLHLAPLTINNPAVEKFIKIINKKFSTNLNTEDILAYYDETLFGSGKKGVLLTRKILAFTINGYKSKIFSLKDISKLELGTQAIINIKIKFTYFNKKEFFILTKDKKAAKIFANILNDVMMLKEK